MQFYRAGRLFTTAGVRFPKLEVTMKPFLLAMMIGHSSPFSPEKWCIFDQTGSTTEAAGGSQSNALSFLRYALIFRSLLNWL